MSGSFRIAALIIGLAFSPAATGQVSPAHAHMTDPVSSGPAPGQPGQSAFGAISEVVTMLSLDPATDWSKVNVDALRQHLQDMDNVMMRAVVKTTFVPGGARFELSGPADVVDSIHRMAPAHAAMMTGQGELREIATITVTGATVTATGGSPADEARIRGLGYFGLLTLGDHHGLHHMMMARGEMHH